MTYVAYLVSGISYGILCIMDIYFGGHVRNVYHSILDDPYILFSIINEHNFVALISEATYLPFIHMYYCCYNRIMSFGVRGVDFITSLTNNSHPNFLAFDGNMLEGVIPENIGNLSKDVTKLYMGHNHFNGSIPSSIGRLFGLKLLNLSYN